MANKTAKTTKLAKTTRPVMALLDLLGRRWALRILWELRDGAQGFRALQERCGEPPPSSLSQRLAELTEARLVELGDEGYRYSREGEELVRLLLPLNEWANRWGKRP
jgi:DNA-binding HxlR family transcriptional regulator